MSKVNEDLIFWRATTFHFLFLPRDIEPLIIHFSHYNNALDVFWYLDTLSKRPNDEFCHLFTPTLIQ